MTDRPAEVRHEPNRHRYQLEENGAVAELIYRTEPGRLIIVHTEVPDALSGRGIGGRLVLAAVDRGAAESLTIVPWCPFARRWLRDHPDVANTVTIDWTTRPPNP